MTQALTKTPALAAPVAPRRPHSFTTHGITVTDDYAWLKDAKWQEVLRDPSILDADIRTYLEAENGYTESLLGHTAPCRKSWSRKCAGGSRRTIPACRRRTARSPICASSARAASTNCSAAPRATAATSRSCSMATRWPRSSLFQVRRFAAFARPQAAGLERRHQGFGIFFDPRARLGDRRGPRRSRRGNRRRGGLEHGRTELLLRQARRQPPADAGLASSPRHRRRRTTRWSMRKRIPAGSPTCMRVPADASA